MRKNSIKRFLTIFAVIAAMSLIMVACAKPQDTGKLIVSIDAVSTIEVKTQFKPEVKLLSGANYTLTIILSPVDSAAAVSAGAFTPDKLGEYKYKITASKAGRENEEEIKTVTAVDTTAPLVDGTPKIFSDDKSTTITFAEMINNLSVTDNFDFTAPSIIFKELYKESTKIDLANGATSYTFLSAGNYKAVFETADSSLNVTEIEILISINGLDVPNTADINKIVGDRLSLPEYSILPQNSGTVKIMFDGFEVSAANLPIITKEQIGTKVLQLQYFVNGNNSAVADETISVNVVISDITIDAVMDFDGKEKGFTSKVPAGIINDSSATVSIKLKKPGETVFTAVTAGAAITYADAGNYTYEYTATKGSYAVTKTFANYVRNINEMLSFENGSFSSAWESTGSSNSGTDPILTSEQTKFGDNSVKMVLPKNTYTEILYANGGIVQKEYNTISIWIYSDIATSVRLGFAQVDDNKAWILDPNRSDVRNLTIGWNEVVSFIPESVLGAKIYGFRITNLGDATATIYADCATYYSDNYIIEKSAKTDVVKGSEVDLNNYFTITGTSEAATVTITAQRGTIALRTYTAPDSTGSDKITVTITETGKTTRTLEINLSIISVAFTVADKYDGSYEVNTDIDVKQATQVGAINPVITVELENSNDEKTIVTGNKFKALVTGWHKVIYTLTCDNESASIVIKESFYISAKGEVASFEDFAGSGRKFANTAGSSVGVSAPTLDSTVSKNGTTSMKIVLAAGKQVMMNFDGEEFMTKPSQYNTINLWINSSIASTVRVGIAQNDENCWWFIDPNSSATYDVKIGWNEIKIDIPQIKGSGNVVSLALTNLGDTEGTFNMDSICFVTEMQIKATDKNKQVILGTQVDLGEYISVAESEDYSVSIKVDDVAISAETYTFAQEKEYTVQFDVTDNVTALVKSLVIKINSVGVSITVDGYDNTVMGTNVTIKTSTVVGTEKAVTVKVTKPDGTVVTVTEGANLALIEGGWYKIEYTQTYDTDKTKVETKKFYVGYENEIASFEDYALSGKDIHSNIGTATSSGNFSNEQAYLGEYSMKFTNINKGERAQILYAGGAAGTAPVITNHEFNKAKVWVYSESAVKVCIALQGDAGWLTSTSEIIDLVAGWQEITMNITGNTNSLYLASIFVDKMTDGTNGTAESIYLDCIRFVNEL